MNGAKMVGFIKTLQVCQYPHKFAFGHFESSPAKMFDVWNWNLDQNLTMTFINHGSLHFAIRKTFHDCKLRRSHELISFPKCSN